jgi:hypothetical protein
MKYSWYYKIPMFIVLGTLIFIGLGLVIESLWNVLIPQLFNGPAITFWQAIGLFVLSKILLHSFGFGRYHGHGWNGRKFSYWKSRMEEKMASMTPEEREKFKEEWSKHCRPGYWHHNFNHHHPFNEEEKK